MLIEIAGHGCHDEYANKQHPHVAPDRAQARKRQRVGALRPASRQLAYFLWKRIPGLGTESLLPLRPEAGAAQALSKRFSIDVVEHQPLLRRQGLEVLVLPHNLGTFRQPRFVEGLPHDRAASAGRPRVNRTRFVPW